MSELVCAIAVLIVLIVLMCMAVEPRTHSTKT